MSIRLGIENRPILLVLDEETITIGSDPTSTVPLPETEGLEARHAVIRKLAGRWLVEARGAESIRIAGGPPTRMHWLSVGDAIQLCDRCPKITFEPTATVPVEISAIEPASTTAASTSKFVRPMLRSDQKSAGSSGSIPVHTPQTNAVSVSSFQAAGEAAQVKPSPSAGNPGKSRTEEVIIPEDDDEPTDNAQKITRGSMSADTPPLVKRPRISKAEIRFWIQVIGGGVLGIVTLIAFLVAMPYLSSRSHVEVYPGWNNPIETTTTAPPTAYVPTTTKKRPASEDKPFLSPRIESFGAPKPTMESTEAPKSAIVEPLETSPQFEQPAPRRSTNTIAPKSKMAEAVQAGVFAVYARHENERSHRLGTAWAASRRHLITSGAIAAAVEDLQRQGLEIIVAQPSLEQPIVIKTIRVNPAYQSAVRRADLARQQLAAGAKPPDPPDEFYVPPDVELARANADQARFDLGVLEVQSGHRLRSPLNIDSAGLPDISSEEFTMVGCPFQQTDSQGDWSTCPMPQDCQSVPASARKSDKDLSISMRFPADVAAANWSGSPVMDRRQRVIGVYSRVSKPTNASAANPARTHAVVWMGRLREFAQDVE